MTIRFKLHPEPGIFDQFAHILIGMCSTFQQLETNMPLMGSAALPFTDLDFLMGYATSFVSARMVKLGAMPFTFTFLTRYGGVETLELENVPQNRDIQLIVATMVHDLLHTATVHAYTVASEMWIGQGQVGGEVMVAPRLQEGRREGVMMRASLPNATAMKMLETVRNGTTGAVTKLVDADIPLDAASKTFNPMFRNLFDSTTLLGEAQLEEAAAPPDINTVN